MSPSPFKVVYRFCGITRTRRKWLETPIFGFFLLANYYRYLESARVIKKKFEKRFWIFRESAYRVTTPLRLCDIRNSSEGFLPT